MMLRTLFIINAVVMLVWGVLHLFLTSQALALYIVAPEAGTMVFAWYYGALLVAAALLSWLVRDIEEPAVERVVVTFFFVAWLLIAVVMLFGLITTGWYVASTLVFIVELLFTLAFGYFLLYPGAIKTTPWARPA
jgi:hypothetical protein